MSDFLTDVLSHIDARAEQEAVSRAHLIQRKAVQHLGLGVIEGVTDQTVIVDPTPLIADAIKKARETFCQRLIDLAFEGARNE